MARIWLLGLVSLSLLGGCYAPSVTDGQFTCALTKLCPSGLSCLEGRCVHPGSAFDLGLYVDIYSGRLGDLDLHDQSGVLSINTETGQWLLNNTEVLAAATPGWKRVPQAGGPPASVFPFRNLVLPSTLQILAAKTSPVSALVLTAQQTIQFDASLDWTGLGAAGAELREARGQDVSGGSSGGATAAGALNSTGTSGGGGGGHGTAGQNGAGSGGGAGGASFGDPKLVPLQFGAGGGGGAGITAVDQKARGGAGGPAVALVTVGEIVFGGSIDVSGAAGQDVAVGFPSDAGSGGGGAGGSILLSAAKITLAATHKLRAHGGVGGVPANQGGVGGVGGVGRIYVTTPSPSYAVGLSPLAEPTAIIGTEQLVGFPQ